jgi:outer membrane receptor protein involved in Fe transport
VNPATGETFPNQIGTMREVGVKAEFLGGRIVATTSYFKSELTNVVIQVVNPPSLGGGTFPQAAGTQRAEGWEMDLAWQPLAGLTTLIAYSDVDSTNEAGRGFRGAPQSPTYSLFAKYSLPKTELRGAGVSLGYRHYGVKPVDATDSFRLAETDSVDLGLYYEPHRKPWSVQLNVYNLLDEDKPFTSVSASAVQLQFPREYRFTLNYRF